MTYSLGQVKPETINVGSKVADPILSLSTMLGTGIIKEVSSLPPGRRLGALRQKLNALYPGMGTEAVSKARELIRKGRSSNQAVVDAVRLSLANRIAEHTEVALEKRGAAGGLGGTMDDIRSGFCVFGAGGSAVAGGWVGAFRDPAASSTITQAAVAGGQIAGCMNEQLNTQRQIAEANARAAEANAMAASAGGFQVAASGAGTGTTIALVGGGVILLGILGYVALK